MITSFQFGRIPKIIFGAGRLKDLPGVIRQYDKNIILVTGKTSFLASSFGSSFLTRLASEGINYRTVSISGEPSPAMIDKAVADLSDYKAGVVVSIGGGSVLDAGKAISAMLYMKEGITDFLEDVGTREHPGSKIPFIAVPTTSGTGSEATKNSVISQTGINGFKKSLRHDNFVPEVALVDPELTLNCPTSITAASGMDCFTQLTEAYLSTKATPFTDALTYEGLKAVRQSLLKCVVDGSDIEARTGMSFAALTSGIGLANAGLGTVHGIAGSIGGIYQIPHGLLCGTLMGACNTITVRKLRKTGKNNAALKKYASLGRLFLDRENKSDDYLIDWFIEYLNYLTVEMKLPGLKTAGIEEASFNNIIASSSSKNNPLSLEAEELAEVLSIRFI
ncbi:MAG TPA: iron-containing alcohol dehydrogenase [Bacteroidales bacterium]|nr:iron-containing alcohol dehydrogenase [Bacteroidales bacterium]